MRILIVEDEKRLNENIAEYFKLKGHVTDSCYDGECAEHYISINEYDAIVLDVMLPKKNGFDVLSSIRKAGVKTPVLILTARDSLDDKVYGLENGANDYLVKPFELRELEARVKVISRIMAGNTTNIYTFEDLEMNLDAHTVTRAGHQIDLSAREYAVFECLMRNKGNVVSREKLESYALGYDYMGGTNLVDVYISFIRKKVDGAYNRKLIHTVRGVGYVIR